MKTKISFSKVVSPTILIALFSLFISCNSEVKKKKIAFIVPTLENPFFVDMTDAAKSAAASMTDVEVIIQAPQKVEDAIGQNQMMENLITQKVDAICVVPTNSETIIPVIKKANASNIPVINIDNKVNPEAAEKAGASIASYIGSDNFDGGKLAGQFIAAKLNGKGKVAILEGVSGNDAATKRKNGFLEVIKQSPGISVVTSQVANWNREQAFTLFQNILKAYPDITAVFACNDEMALGAYAAMTQAKISKDKLVIVGFDAVEEAVNAVNSGKLDATVAQQPKLMGTQSLQLSLDLIAGKTISKTNSTELKLIKK